MGRMRELIDRQALIAEYDRVHVGAPGGARKLMVDAPTIEERKTGHYIGEADGYADGELVYDIWSCSECGCYFEDWDEQPTYNFCPNCGADMRETT